MDRIQKMMAYFTRLRKHLQKRRGLVTAVAAAVVFATTYALILPAVTLDEDTASDTPGVSIEQSADAEKDGAATEATPEDSSAQSAAEPAATESAEQEVAPANEQAGAQAAEEPAATDADPQPYSGTLDHQGDGYRVSATVPAEASLPEGVTVDSSEVTRDADPDAYDRYYQAALAQVRKQDPNVTDFSDVRFFDITFKDAEGQEVEPQSDVSVDISLDDPMQVDDPSSVRVIHIDDKADDAASVVPDDKTTVDATDGQLAQATFKADSFSIYAITETTDTSKTKEYRRTYTFINDDGSNYTFDLQGNPSATSGTSSNTQIVKAGEDLKSVGTPEAKTEDDQGHEFLGWEVVSKSDNVSDLTVGTVITLPRTESATTKTADESVTLKAKFGTDVTLTFYGPDNTTVIYKEKVAQNSKVDLSNYHATAEISGGEGQMVKSFIGWNTQRDANEPMTIAGEGGSNAYPNYTASADATFYPVYKEGYWLYFNANDSDSDVKATFTESEFAARGETKTEGDATSNDKAGKPSDPQRQGYAFGGWYSDQACTQPFTWGNTLTANTTLYARWTPSDTTYTVVVWRQRLDDDKNTEDSTKTYDYGDSFTVEAKTGDIISSSTDMYSGTGYSRQDMKNPQVETIRVFTTHQRE